MIKKTNLLYIALAVFLLFLLCSCETHRKLDVPGLTDFEANIKKEYPYVKRISCILNNPASYSVRCTLSKHIVPEKMTDLIATLKEYALTDVFNKYNESFTSDSRIVFLEFYVGTKYYFRYRYDTGGYDEPIWVID